MSAIAGGDGRGRFPRLDGPHPRGSRREALRLLLAAALFNCAVTLVVGRSYLASLPPETSAIGWTSAIAALLSTVTSLNSLAFIACVPFVILFNRRWVLLTICPLAFTLVQVFVAADAVIFGLFQFHINGMIVNLLTTSGAEDTLTVGPATVVSAALTILALFAVTWGLSWLTLRPWLASRLRLRRMLPVAAALLAATAVDKGLYAYGDLVNRVELTRSGRLFPLYQRVTMRKFARDRGFAVAHHSRLEHRRDATMLRYPKTAVQPPATVRPLNVIVVAIEGCRFDMLDPEVMPRLYAWSASQRVYRNHFSGGNASRFGIFSLLYGIYGTYWHTVLAERQGSFLIHELQQLGYHFHIASCASLNFPEFRQTAFVEIPEAIHDRWEGPRVDRDKSMTTGAIDFMDQGRRPFFQFLFYDASHATYIYPPEHEIFRPVIRPEEVDFLDLSGRVSAETLRPLFNRYRNSLHYIDAQLGRLFDALEQRGLMDDTLVFVTGDHGEEFGELGYFSHNSTFSRYQAQVVMVAHVPGHVAANVTRLTSHLDIVPTIFQEIGVRAPTGAYSQGTPLTDETGADHVVVSSWDQLGVIGQDSVIVVGTESYDPDIRVYDRDYRPLSDQGAALAGERRRLLEVMHGMGEFSR